MFILSYDAIYLLFFFLLILGFSQENVYENKKWKWGKKTLLSEASLVADKRLSNDRKIKNLLFWILEFFIEKQNKFIIFIHRLVTKKLLTILSWIWKSWEKKFLATCMLLKHKKSRTNEDDSKAKDKFQSFAPSFLPWFFMLSLTLNEVVYEKPANNDSTRKQVAMSSTKKIYQKISLEFLH